MNLKNKDIMERMRVTNGKDELKVISWDKSYTDCLLNYLDSKGNRYVVAQSYELSGTEKDPQISWANGRYFTANSDDEALEEYLDYLGEVNEYDISESLKKKSIKEKISRKYKYEFRHFGDFEIVQFDDRNFEIYAVHKDTENILNFKIEKTYVYEDYNDDICLFVGEVEELGWCFIAFDKHENDDNIYAYQYHESDKSWAYMCLNSYKLYLENKKVYRTRNIESKKKSSRKNLKESQEYNFDYFYQLLKDDKHFSVNYAHDDLPDDDTVYANGTVDVKWFIDGKRLNHSAILSIPCFSMVFTYEGLLFNCEHGSRYDSVIGYADISDVRFTSDILSLLLVNGLRVTFNLY